MLKFVFAIVAVAVVGLLRHTVLCSKYLGSSMTGLVCRRPAKGRPPSRPGCAYSSWPRARGRAGYRRRAYTHELRNVQRGSLVQVADGGA
eukprot:5596282-Pyramimonas_sp.AAC.2